MKPGTPQNNAALIAFGNAVRPYLPIFE